MRVSRHEHGQGNGRAATDKGQAPPKPYDFRPGTVMELPRGASYVPIESVFSTAGTVQFFGPAVYWSGAGRSYDAAYGYFGGTQSGYEDYFGSGT